MFFTLPVYKATLNIGVSKYSFKDSQSISLSTHIVAQIIFQFTTSEAIIHQERQV